MPSENPTSSAVSSAPKPPSKLALWAEAREKQAGNFLEKTVTSVRDSVSELIQKTFEVETIDQREMVKSVLFTGSLATAAVMGPLV